MSESAKCELCGEPMPPLPKKRPTWIEAAAKECAERVLVGEGARAFAEIIERHAAQGKEK